MFHYSKVLLISFLTSALAAPLLPGQEIGSHARIVRISYLEGTVQLNDESATMNSPIREGVVLRTGTDGLAEVQFEDGSAIRMASETQVTFAQLARLTSGETITRVDLDDGEAEFLIPASSAGQFAVNAGNKNLLFKDPGRYRVLSTNASPLEIAVWKGEVSVRDRESGKETAVRKNETFTLNPSDPGQYDLENALVADDLDQWSDMRDQTLASAPATSVYSYTSPYSYASTSSSYSPFYGYGYGSSYYNCNPYSPGWGWQPGGLYGNCWSSGYSGYYPWFFPPGGIFFTPTPIVTPHRPPHLRPPTVTAAAPPAAPGTVVAPHQPLHPIHPPTAATAETGSVPVRPGVRSFRFDQGTQRVFNEDNFQRSVPRAEHPASSEVVKTGDSHPAEPLVSPGHRSTVSAPGPASAPLTSVPPSPASGAAPHPSTPSPASAPLTTVPRPPASGAAPHPSTPSGPSRPSPSTPPRSYSPPSSSGSHAVSGGFSGGSMSHSSGSAPSHSGGGGGRH